MTRLAIFAAALVAALAAAALASRPPPARPADAPAEAFSAGRAMADVRALAIAPRPTGSVAHAQARTHLVRRLRALGLQVSTQSAPLSERARERLRRWGGPAAAPELVNIIARLPGRDPTQPAVALMAHYDTVAGSPGAADDAAGVAAVLETVRAIRAGPVPRRDIVVVFTDAEELNLDGARAFFADHPSARRIGVVINLEARGGAGRALMFETGERNGGLMRLYADAADRPSAQSLAVLIYRLMPNSSDFTLAREHRIPGFNFAILGGADQYHSPRSTADALSGGSLQHLGDQALGLARALALVDRLPSPTPDAVFSDVLGRWLVVYTPPVGWMLAAAAGALIAAGVVCSRGPPLALAVGTARALTLLLHSVLAMDLLNRVSGAGPRAGYLDRLAALPRLEVVAGVTALVAALAVLSACRARLRVACFAPVLLLAAADVSLGAAPLIVAPLALVAGGLLAVLPRSSRKPSEWLGALCLLLVLTIAAQALAPTAAPLMAWPVLAGSAAAAAAFALDPRLDRPAALLAPVAAVTLAGGQVLAMAHLAFLGVGAELAPALALFALIVATLAWPLAPARMDRRLAAILAILMVIAVGVALSVRWDPATPTALARAAPA